MAIMGGVDLDKKRLRRVERNAGLIQDFPSSSLFLAGFSNIAKTQNWENMSRSTAQGVAAADGDYYLGSFDGRYIYFVPFGTQTFLRYDTTLLLTNSSAYEKMSMSTAQGEAGAAFSYYTSTFDGRYVYFTPKGSGLYMRFDATKAFTNSSAWEKVSATTAVGAWENNSVFGAVSDGRYVYFCPYANDTFVRYDTTLAFTNSNSWERINVSTAENASRTTYDYNGCCFDGRYVYYTPQWADFFIRYDNTMAFTNSSAWAKASMSTMQGSAAIDSGYRDCVFDGKYVYFGCENSDTFLRYNTGGTFESTPSWERMSISTASGFATMNGLARSLAFDGRFVYYGAGDTATVLKFDTTMSFTNSSAWSTMNLSTAQGSAFPAATGHLLILFDGKYVNFLPYSSLTFLRVLACPSKIGKFGR